MSKVQSYVIEDNYETYTVKMTREQLAVIRWLNTIGYEFEVKRIDLVEPIDISDYMSYDNEPPEGY